MDALLVPRFLVGGRPAALCNWVPCTRLVTSGTMPRVMRDSRHALATKKCHCTLPRDHRRTSVTVTCCAWPSLRSIHVGRTKSSRRPSYDMAKVASGSEDEELASGRTGRGRKEVCGTNQVFTTPWASQSIFLQRKRLRIGRGVEGDQHALLADSSAALSLDNDDDNDTLRKGSPTTVRFLAPREP